MENWHDPPSNLKIPQRHEIDLEVNAIRDESERCLTVFI